MEEYILAIDKNGKIDFLSPYRFPIEEVLDTNKINEMFIQQFVYTWISAYQAWNSNKIEYRKTGYKMFTILEAIALALRDNVFPYNQDFQELYYTLLNT